MIEFLDLKLFKTPKLIDNENQHHWNYILSDFLASTSINNTLRSNFFNFVFQTFWKWKRFVI
jgi:hypothetical protein